MIVLNLVLKRIYGFNDFNINFSYPKKIVNSIIDQEYLKGRVRFRYKKAVILMGANATGKTSLGKHCFVFLDIWLMEIQHRFMRWSQVIKDTLVLTL